MGFTVNNNFYVSSNTKSLYNYHQSTLKKRDKLGYEIDGVVFKVNSFKLKELLGINQRTVNYAIAFKFPGVHSF